MTIDLISKCKNSHEQYEIYKTEKGKLKPRLLQDAATKMKEAENQDKLAEIERDIRLLQNRIKMEIMKEGNKEVQSHLLKKVLNRNELTQSNIVCANGVNGCAWCLAGGRKC